MLKPVAIVVALLTLFAIPGALQAEPLKVCIISGSELYGSEISMPKFKVYLEKNFEVECTVVQAEGKENLPGLEALDTCDVALVFTRRLEVAGEQLEKIKNYCLGGKPLVGIRTASHAFQNFLELDKEVFGGNYDGHHKKDVPTRLTVAPGAEEHPILKGYEPFESLSSLYRTGPLAKDTHQLLSGTNPNDAQPLAWTREYNGGRVFYTSLGSVEDFEIEAFRRLVANALFWCAGREAGAQQ
jgi:type 1 glutamine amidotransferase